MSLELDRSGRRLASDSLTYFRGSRPQPSGSTPLFLDHDETDVENCRRRRCRRCGRYIADVVLDADNIAAVGDVNISIFTDWKNRSSFVVTVNDVNKTKFLRPRLRSRPPEVNKGTW